jgi:alpha-amylase
VTVVPQADWSEAVLYFAITDRWADGDLTNDANVDRPAKGTFHGGDLKGLRAHLDEIAGLGATSVWITPVVKNIDGFVSGAGFPDWAYHGYWADDFTKLDPRFGSEAELKALVDECHRRGMKVLLDVVYNHAGYESHYLKDPKTKDWLRSEERGTCGQDDLTTCVAGLPDFKTELPEVADFLLQAQLGWAKRSGVDGFRLDTVKHVGHPFWQEHRRRTREQLGDGFFLLGEVWGGDAQVLDPWFSTDELDAGFDFGFQGSVLGFVQGRGRAVAFDRYLKSREKVRPGHLLAHFLSSHDVPGALFQLGGDTTLFRLAAVLEFTSIGIPVIYYGEEVARPGGDWPENRSDMPWGERNVLPGEGKARDEALRADYKRLIAIRRAHPALYRGVHEKLVAEGDLLVFAQHDLLSGETVVVALNRGETPLVARFPVPEGWGAGPIRDDWNGVALPLTNGAVETTLGGKTARSLVHETRH